MSYISVPNTFENGLTKTVNANEINENFTAITDGLSDGLSDIRVNDIKTTVGQNTVSGYTKIGGDEFIKIKSFTHTITAGEAVLGEATLTLSETHDVSKIRGIIMSILDSINDTNYCNHFNNTNASKDIMASGTDTVVVKFGGYYIAGDVIQVLIIEAE